MSEGEEDPDLYPDDDPPYEPQGEAVPAYLLVSKSIQDEARRAYVLNLLINAEGAFHPDWAEIGPQLIDILVDGKWPRKLKAVK